MAVPQTEIIIRKDGVELARRVVAPGEYVIGRGDDADFQIKTPAASRHHAKLTVRADEWLVEDLASANGTFINDSRIEPGGPARVFPSQSLRVGDVAVALRRLHGEAEARKYDIGAEVARGGMGAILDARDAAIARSVAMKVMLADATPEDAARFAQEARITGQLEHPNIVPVHELATDEHGRPFYTMKMVHGITLGKVLGLLAQSVAATAEKFPLPVLLTVFQKVCDAIAFAHSRGVIHRDLKPENIMLGDYGEVLVMDWGIAKVLAERPTASVQRTTPGDAGIEQTMTGTVMGTPQFMAPEQAGGEIEKLDARTDIYSLGAILYQVLTLQPSVEGRTVEEVLSKVVRGEVAPLVTTRGKTIRKRTADGVVQSETGRQKSGIPASLAAVVRKAMSRLQADRYATVPELQAEITAFQNGFATGAEKAGALRQFTLFIRRNKAASIGAAAVLLVGGILGTKALIEGRRAEATLGRLRGTAPTFIAQARALVAEEKFDDALQKLAFALDLAPDDATAHLLRGHILQTQLRFAESAASFQRVVRLDSNTAFVADARANLALCERLRAASGGGPVKKELLRELHAALLAQRRTGEASALARHGLGREELYRGYEEKLVAAHGEAFRGRIQRLPDDTLRFDIEGTGAPLLTDLRGFAGLPFSDMRLVYQKFSDLTPLAGMPLTRLDIARTQIRDLSPLRGLPLRELHVPFTEVSDLSPLAGMKLEILGLAGCDKVRDLSPLRGMPLRELWMVGIKATDLSVLRGMPLEMLDVADTAIDVRLLKGMPLKYLRIAYTAASDLTPLIGMPLENLDFTHTAVRDLTPLRGMPLKRLMLTRLGPLGPESLPIDLEPLRGLPLEVLFLQDSDITDLSPLLDCPALREIILPAKATNIPLLRHLPRLERLSFRYEPDRPAQTVAEFWAEYDAKAK